MAERSNSLLDRISTPDKPLAKVLQMPENPTQEQICRGKQLGHMFLNAAMELARKQRNAE